MPLDRLELAQRNRGEARVFRVSTEDPRVIRISRTDPGRPADRPGRSRELLALVGPADLEVPGLQSEIGDVLLAPLDRVLHQRISWQRQPSHAGELLAGRHLLGQRPRRVAQQLGQLAPSLRLTVIRACDPQPHSLRFPGPKRQRIVELTARPLAERSVIALRRLGFRRRAGFGAGAAMARLRAPEFLPYGP